MKKLLLFTLGVSLVSSLGAASVADQFNALIILEKGHKADWFNVRSTISAQEMNLIKQQHGAWADFKKGLITDWGNGKNLSQDHVLKAINLHKAQKADWKKFNQDSQKLIADTAKKHDDELEKFEIDYGFIKKPTTAAKPETKGKEAEKEADEQ